MDDDRPLVDAFAIRLGSHLTIVPATSTRQALELFQAEGPFPVVVTDMHMPGHTGLELAEAMRRQQPDTMFILLTGDRDQSIAAEAINRASVFRFLRKPCTAGELEEAILAADRRHRVIVAEKALLRDTLAGCVRMMLDALGTAHPEMLERAGQVRETSHRLTCHLPHPTTWTLGIAAQLAFVGELVIPEDSEPPTGFSEHRRRVARAGGDLVRHIPRMEPVAKILESLEEAGPLPEPDSFADGDDPEAIRFASRVIRFSIEWWDAITEAGGDRRLGLERILATGCDHDPQLLIAAHALLILDETGVTRPRIERIGPSAFADLTRWISGRPAPRSVHGTDGLLLVAKGVELTPQMLAYIRAFDRAGLIARAAA